MKYYYTPKGCRFPQEITKGKFYSLRKRKDAHESICITNGKISSRRLKFY